MLMVALMSSQASALSHRFWPKPYWECSVPFCQYVYDKAYFDAVNNKKNPLLAPPNNLAAGDGQTTIATKILSSRVDIIQNQVKDMANAQLAQNSAIKNATKTFQDMSKKVEKVTSQKLDMNTGWCDLKSSMNYDLNKNALTAQSVCESYNAKVVYSTLQNTYEASLFKQLDPQERVGIKTTSFFNSCLVFVEGSW